MVATLALAQFEPVGVALSALPAKQQENNCGTKERQHGDHDPKAPVAPLARHPGVGSVEADNERRDKEDGAAELDPSLDLLAPIAIFFCLLDMEDAERGAHGVAQAPQPLESLVDPVVDLDHGLVISYRQ